MRIYSPFRKYLSQKGTSKQAIKRYIQVLELYEQFVKEHKEARRLDNVTADDIDLFVCWLNKEKIQIGAPRRGFWAYGRFTGNWSIELEALLSIGRNASPLRIGKLKGISNEQTKLLESVGIKNIDHLIKALTTRAERINISQKTGIPFKTITMIVKVADFTRIVGIQGANAELYHKVCDTIEQLSDSDPDELFQTLVKYNKRKGILLPSELTTKHVKSFICQAKRLPRLVKYD